MDIQALLNDPDLTNAISGLQARITKSKRQYSDIIDDAGNQYVDLVMEGGGMLGIALVGYTWALEQAGIRFLGIGGTSAGSINALLIAALNPPGEAKSPKLLKLLGEKNFYDFVDGDSDARDFIDSWIEGAGKIKLAFKAAQVLDSINDKMGLNPGTAFEQWIRDILAAEGIRTLAELRQRMHTLPQGLRERGGRLLDTPEKAANELAIVAADVATETKVVFPKHTKLYFANPDAVNPARFVRASMSIPYFFQPYKLSPLPKGDEAEANWLEVGYEKSKEKGGLPKYGLFVDGGIMSNFPIDLFHDYSKVPSAPTFGIKLEYDQRRHDINGPLQLFGAIFNSARHCLDYDFLHRNPDYKKLIQWIPCQQYNWLDFKMSDKDKAGLFKEGALAAVSFLETFDWPAYKTLRAGMVRN
jgi:NTE family protein